MLPSVTINEANVSTVRLLLSYATLTILITPDAFVGQSTQPVIASRSSLDGRKVLSASCRHDHTKRWIKQTL